MSVYAGVWEREEGRGGASIRKLKKNSRLVKMKQKLKKNFSVYTSLKIQRITQVNSRLDQIKKKYKQAINTPEIAFRSNLHVCMHVYKVGGRDGEGNVKISGISFSFFNKKKKLQG